MALTLSKIPAGRVVSAIEVAAIEATNNRRAVERLRFFLRWALSEIDGPVTRSLGYQNAVELLEGTTRCKLRGL